MGRKMSPITISPNVNVAVTQTPAFALLGINNYETNKQKCNKGKNNSVGNFNYVQFYS